MIGIDKRGRRSYELLAMTTDSYIRRFLPLGHLRTTAMSPLALVTTLSGVVTDQQTAMMINKEYEEADGGAQILMSS